MMLLKQTLNFLPRQVVRQRLLAPEGGLYDGALLLLQRQNLLLHRATRDELVAGHHTGLADAVGAVRGLVLNRRIPPRVEMNDCVRAGERETHAAGLEADEKDGNLRVALEFLHHGTAICGRAVEVAELNVLRREPVLKQRKHRRELAEDQHAMTAVHGLLQQLAKHR